MPDSVALLALAEALCNGQAAAVEQNSLRRAVSTAYYAMFHRVLRAAADRFIGSDQQESAAYAILYRNFDHGPMRSICRDLDTATLNERLRRLLRRDRVSAELRSFASAFVALQDARHSADYDPSAWFEPSDAELLVVGARAALAAFDRIAPDELTDFLALLMARARS